MSGSAIRFVTDGVAVTAQAHWPGGRGTFAGQGTFNGATIALRWRLPGTVATWATLTSLTAAGVQNFEVAAGDIDIDISGGVPADHSVSAVPFR